MPKKLFDKDVSALLKKRHPFYEEKLFKEKLLSWKEMENLINCRPFMSNRRVRVPNGFTYSWPYQHWLSDVNTYPPETLKEMLDKHWWYIMDCSRVNEKINEVCKNLETVTGNPTDAHIFISTKTEKDKGFNNKSFGRHKDEQDNLIVMVEGSAKIEIYKRDKPKEVGFEKVFKPGDAVFIPRGVFHKLTGLEKRLSLSFSMVPHATPHPFQDREWIKLS